PWDLRILHLDGARRAVEQRGTMHRGQGGGRERRLVHMEEDLAERPAQLALDLALHLGERSRRNGVVEAPEPLDEGSGEVVRARAHYLAELDEESGEVDAEVVQPERDVIVHALPDLGRRGAAEPFAQIEPAVADDR